MDINPWLALIPGVVIYLLGFWGFLQEEANIPANAVAVVGVFFGTFAIGYWALMRPSIIPFQEWGAGAIFLILILAPSVMTELILPTVHKTGSPKTADTTER